jgi:hypothetical protein
MSQKINVKTVQNDRFARTTEVQINEKVIHTPNFCTLVQNDSEMDSLINLSLLSDTKHIGTYVTRVFDAPKVILPRLQNRVQRSIADLSMSTEDSFMKFSKKSVFIVDPALEYLLYEFHANKFANAIKQLRAGTKHLDILLHYFDEREKKKQETGHEIFENWKKAYHKKFWCELDRNQAERNKFIGEFLDLETKCNTDVILPPVPIIDSENLFDIAVSINSFAKTIASRNKPCATYLLFQKGLLGNDSLVEKVAKYILNDPTQLTIIKIKNLDIWTSGAVRQRETYKQLMDAMYEARKANPNKIFMTLESWYVSYAAACYGFNIVSSTMSGFDRDSEFGKNVYGSWFDPEHMYYVPFDELKMKVLKNTNNVMPCYCPICKGIKNLSSIDKDEWYKLRREHYVLSMNEYMRQISHAIDDRTIELSRDKLANSQLPLLQHLIPRK